GRDHLEPPALPDRRVLDQAQEAERAHGCRPARLFLGESLKLSDQRLSLHVEELRQACPFRLGVHSYSLPDARRQRAPRRSLIQSLDAAAATVLPLASVSVALAPSSSSNAMIRR